jgi:HSP20 family protein
MSLLTLTEPTLDRFERLFSPLSRRLFPFENLATTFAAPGAYVPNIDLCEDKDNFYILAELPGMKQEDIKVKLEGNLITISGRKERKDERTERNYYAIERSFGEFARSMGLPTNVKTDAIIGTMTDGLLELTLPKTSPDEPKVREIPLGGTQSTAQNGKSRPS